jgi:signal transduction histidine kinase
MKRDSSSYLALGLTLFLCVLIYLADLDMPLDLAVWLAYFVLVALLAWFAPLRLAVIAAAFSTVLIVLGFFVAPLPDDFEIAAVNRAVDILLIWAATYLIGNRRHLLDRTARQAADLQAQAEVLQTQAKELQALARELRTQNDELSALNDTLEQRVEERTQALRRANDSLKQMSVRLAAVQENERRAIARELHDESGQVLTAMIIRLRVLRELLARGESPVETIDELRQMTDQLADGLHRLAVDLRPASLDRAGLVPALQQYIQTYRKTHRLRVEFMASGFDGDGTGAHDLESTRLAPEVESTLYRIVQEALTNIARHAQATQVSVVLFRRPDAVAAIVEDNGIGFDVEAAERAGRLGLTGMRERAELRGGTLTIESRPGVRTTVFVEIPCA